MTVFNNILVILQRPVHLPILSWSLFNQYSAQYSFQARGCFPIWPLFKQQIAVREGNEACRNDYHQSSERILAEPGIEPATSYSKVRNATNSAKSIWKTQQSCNF